MKATGSRHDVGLDYIAAKRHFDSEHLDTEAVQHDKLLVVVLMEKSPFGYKGIIQRVQPLTYGRLFGLQIPSLTESMKYASRTGK